MFGYIRPFVPELKVKEQEMYKAVYCGLCKCMGRTTAPVSRLTLSYDFVFLAIFRMALSGEGYKVKKGRCGLNPFRSRPIMQNNPELEYCSRVSVLLNYHSLLDKMKDKGAGKLKAVLLMPFVKSMCKRIDGMDDVRDEIKRCLDALDCMEKDRVPSPDAASQTFGELVAYLTSRGFEGDEYDIAYQAGLNLGRYIYLADAADDYAKDKKSGDYNPFVLCGADLPTDSERVRDALSMQANGVYQAALLLGGDEILCGIAENTAQYGMIHTAHQIFEKKRKADR